MVALYGTIEEIMWWNSLKDIMSYSVLYVKFGKVEIDLGGVFSYLQGLVTIRSSLC